MPPTPAGAAACQRWCWVFETLPNFSPMVGKLTSKINDRFHHRAENGSVGSVRTSQEFSMDPKLRHEPHAVCRK